MPLVVYHRRDNVICEHQDNGTFICLGCKEVIRIEEARDKLRPEMFTVQEILEDFPATYGEDEP